MFDENHLLLKAAYIVTMDAQRSVFSPGYVEIKDDRIVSVGAEKLPDVACSIDYGNAAIIPGLLNSHNHLAMSLMRGVADDLLLEDWLKNHIWPLEAKFVSPEYVFDGALLSAAEILKTGTTFVSDMYFFEDKVAEACTLAGLRLLIGEGIIAFPTPSVNDPDSIFAIVRDMVARYENNPLVDVQLAPHSTYATSKEQLIKCAKLSAELNLPVQIHCAESQNEAMQALESLGKSQIAYLDDIGLLSQKLSLVHMVWPQKGDMELLKRKNISIVSCPQSNLKLGSGFPPIAQYLDEGVRLCLGTDGAASNNNLDIWEELRLAVFIAKGSRLDPRTLSAKKAFGMVTIDAARACGMQDKIGSLEPTKQADIAVVALDEPNTTPCYDIYSTLVYAAAASNIRDVFVAGKKVLDNGRLTAINEADVLAKARSWAKKMEKKN